MPACGVKTGISWTWFWIIVSIALACYTVWGADITPRRNTRQPSFKIISIREQRVDLMDETDGQLTKHYAVDVEADGGIWKLVINQDNRTVAQRFLRR